MVHNDMLSHLRLCAKDVVDSCANSGFCFVRRLLFFGQRMITYPFLTDLAEDVSGGQLGFFFLRPVGAVSIDGALPAILIFCLIQ